MVPTRYGPLVTCRPGAASTLLRELLTGPRREARVVGRHPTCVYVLVDDDVAAVETADGVGLPASLRLGVDARSGVLSAVRRDERPRIGAGGLSFADLTVTVGRWWSPRRPRPVREGDCLPHRISRLADLVAAHPAPVDVDSSVENLVGLGPGLTPAGDDVLAGMLVGVHHSPDARAVLVDRVLPLTHRTTTLSATLLRNAASGHGVPALLDVADLVAGHGAAELLPPAVDRLVRVGHSSGTALAWGLLVGSRHAAAARRAAA